MTDLTQCIRCSAKVWHIGFQYCQKCRQTNILCEFINCELNPVSTYSTSCILHDGMAAKCGVGTYRRFAILLYKVNINISNYTDQE